MEHGSLEKLLALGFASVVGIVGWALFNIVELKADMASVKSDVKHISKTVDIIRGELVFNLNDVYGNEIVHN